LLKEVEKLLEVPPLFFLLLSPGMGPAGEDLYHSECTGFMALKFWKLGVHFVVGISVEDRVEARTTSLPSLAITQAHQNEAFRNKSC
jgi:hypothetical protein